MGADQWSQDTQHLTVWGGVSCHYGAECILVGAPYVVPAIHARGWARPGRLTLLRRGGTSGDQAHPTSCRSLLGPDHNKLVSARFGAPDLTRSSKHLTHLSR